MQEQNQPEIIEPGPAPNTLEVGTNSKGEVIINHPHLETDAKGVGHIVLSPGQALNLSRIITKQAMSAIKEISLLPGLERLWEATVAAVDGTEPLIAAADSTILTAQRDAAMALLRECLCPACEGTGRVDKTEDPHPAEQKPWLAECACPHCLGVGMNDSEELAAKIRAFLGGGK